MAQGAKEHHTENVRLAPPPQALHSAQHNASVLPITSFIIFLSLDPILSHTAIKTERNR